MKTILVLLGVILAACIQVAWFGHVRPLGVMPNIVLIIVIVSALWWEATPSLAVALLGGLLLDLTSGSDFGLRMGFFSVVVLAIVALKQLGLHSTSVITGIGLLVVATILSSAAILATIQAPFSFMAAGKIGAEVIVNIAVMLSLYLLRYLMDIRQTIRVQDERRLWR